MSHQFKKYNCYERCEEETYLGLSVINHGALKKSFRYATASRQTTRARRLAPRLYSPTPSPECTFTTKHKPNIHVKFSKACAADWFGSQPRSLYPHHSAQRVSSRRNLRNYCVSVTILCVTDYDLWIVSYEI